MGLMAPGSQFVQAPMDTQTDSSVEEAQKLAAQAAIAAAKTQEELGALDGQFLTLVPHNTNVTRQALEGMSVHVMAELVGSMTDQLKGDARHLRVRVRQSALDADGRRSVVDLKED